MPPARAQRQLQPRRAGTRAADHQVGAREPGRRPGLHRRAIHAGDAHRPPQVQPRSERAVPHRQQASLRILRLDGGVRRLLVPDPVEVLHREVRQPAAQPCRGIGHRRSRPRESAEAQRTGHVRAEEDRRVDVEVLEREPERQLGQARGRQPLVVEPDPEQ